MIIGALFLWVGWSTFWTYEGDTESTVVTIVMQLSPAACHVGPAEVRYPALRGLVNFYPRRPWLLPCCARWRARPGRQLRLGCLPATFPRPQCDRPMRLRSWDRKRDLTTTPWRIYMEWLHMKFYKGPQTIPKWGISPVGKLLFEVQNSSDQWDAVNFGWDYHRKVSIISSL